jgi:hypothetical protein
MRGDTSQGQYYDRDRELGGHQVKDEPVVLVLLWEEELHFGGGFGTLTTKIDSAFSFCPS